MNHVVVRRKRGGYWFWIHLRHLQPLPLLPSCQPNVIELFLPRSVVVFVNSSLSVWKSCVLKQQRLAFCRNINGSFQKANRNRARRHPTRCPHRKEMTGWNWNVPFWPLRSRSIKVYAWKRFNHFITTSHHRSFMCATKREMHSRILADQIVYFFFPYISFFPLFFQKTKQMCRFLKSFYVNGGQNMSIIFFLLSSSIVSRTPHSCFFFKSFQSMDWITRIRFIIIFSKCYEFWLW